MARQLAHKPDQFQQQAIDSTARGIRIVAPAGSGKSETLARRVAKRIEQDGIDPRRILILTFDNAAKKSLSGFFGDLLDRRQMPQIRTFNGHGNQILRDYFPTEKSELTGNIPSTEVRDLYRSTDARGYDFPVLGWDGVPRSLRDVFIALKNQGYFPGRDGERDKQTQWLRDEYLRLPREGESASFDDYWGMPAAVVMDDSYAAQLGGVITAFGEFEASMRALGRMTFEDQKARAVQQLFLSRSACTRLQAEFDEIVVDESQDISRLDAMLVYYSAGPATLIVLAGDDDQTLYEWRNAHSLYLRHPEMVFKNIEFETIHLNLNYRSPQEILGPAVRLISHNVERIEKSPSSGVKTQGELQVLPAGSKKVHDTDLVQGIKATIDAGTKAENIAVLCHPRDSRVLETPLKALLEREGIPVAEVDRDEQLTKPGVWIRSFLKAKGRQWEVVFIPDLSDREVPDVESVRKGEIESIRRRFYVAMTRARHKLVLSYVRGGEVDRIDYTAEGEVVSTNGASRFLFEAGVVQAAEAVVTLEIPETKPALMPAEPAPAPPAGTLPPAPPVPVAATEKPADRPVFTPEPRPEPVVAKPPIPSPAPPARKTRLKEWDPRADDTRKLVKARSEWEAGDFDTAILCAWKPVESALRRMVTMPTAPKSADMITVIDEALVQGVIDVPWKNNLHLWRQVRNMAFHDDQQKSRFTPAQFKDYGYQLVDGASGFFEHLAEHNAPKQLVLETQDEFLIKLTNLVTLIQLDKPSPTKKKPIRAIRFDPELNQFEVLAMQLLMVLRDVRFYVPEDYRWSTSPIIGKFVVDAVGHLPGKMSPLGTNRLRMQPGEQLNQLMARFSRMVQQEAGDTNPGEFMKQRLEDGLQLGNGNFHAGLKLNPRVKV